VKDIILNFIDLNSEKFRRKEGISKNTGPWRWYGFQN